MGRKFGQADEELERIAEEVLDRLGFELVDLERAGHRSRPLLRLRIDKPESEPGHGITVNDCAKASRELEAVLDAREDIATSYILEVSSPGVERPLRKRRDFERSLGREISIRGYEPLVGGSKRIEGELIGLGGTGDQEILRMRVADGTEIEVPITAVAEAHLVFKWDGIRLKGRAAEK